MDEILCHCRMNPDGHAPGSVLDCEGPVIRVGVYARPQVGGNANAGHPWTGATGTCPDCTRRGVRVRREVVGGHLPGQEKRRAKGYEGAPLGVVPALVPHNTPGRNGRPCTGAGKVPAETRYTSSPLIGQWARAHGAEYVDAGGALLDLPEPERAA